MIERRRPLLAVDEDSSGGVVVEYLGGEERGG
jgi:hypothetical protein